MKEEGTAAQPDRMGFIRANNGFAIGLMHLLAMKESVRTRLGTVHVRDAARALPGGRI